MDFHSNLSDSKSPKVSRTLLSILIDLNNAVVRMVSARPSISKTSRFFYQVLEDRTKHTIYNWYHRHLKDP